MATARNCLSRLKQLSPGGANVFEVATNVYIDGFNLYYGCLKHTQYRWLDLEAFCRKMLPKDDITRIRYFTARITARSDDPDAPTRQDTYLRALGTLPIVYVHYGHFREDVRSMALAHPQPGEPTTVKVLKSEEKGSDVNLATYLLADAFRGDCHVSVVVSNDSDLAEPIRIVRHELHHPVGIINPQASGSRSRHLNDVGVTFFKQVRPRALRQCQFPEVLRDGDGDELRRPNRW